MTVLPTAADLLEAAIRREHKEDVRARRAAEAHRLIEAELAAERAAREEEYARVRAFLRDLMPHLRAGAASHNLGRGSIEDIAGELVICLGYSRNDAQTFDELEEKIGPAPPADLLRRDVQ